MIIGIATKIIQAGISNNLFNNIIDKYNQKSYVKSLRPCICILDLPSNI